MRFHPSFLVVPALLLACVATTDPDGTVESAASVGDSETDGKRPPLMAALLPIDDSIDPTMETKPPRPLIVPFVLPPKADGSHCALVHLEPPKDGVAPPPPPDAPPPGDETKPPKPPTLTVSSMTGTDDVTIAWSTPPAPAPEGEVAPKGPPLQLVQIALVTKPSTTDGPPPKPPADLLSCVVAKGETTITIARTLIDSLLATPHASDASAAVAVAMFPPPPATPPAPPTGDGASMPKPPLGRGIVKLVAVK